VTDLDDIAPDLRGDWDHANKRGKVQGTMKAAKAPRGAAHPARGSNDGRLRKPPPITLPAISIQKRDDK
jgi:hypothetical protein